MEKDAEKKAKEHQELLAERNNLFQKSQSLSKDMSRLTKNKRSVREIESIISKYEQLVVSNSILKAEKNHALDEMNEYKTLSDMTINARERAGVVGEAERAVLVKTELERIIRDLTEAVGNKDMQLDLMRDVNRKLAAELEEERAESAAAAAEGQREVEAVIKE